jgi:UDP-N-acetylglucosamine--N-acetylmuramyl-(pentapeptide) pyrophosphoryl-undecaprenol N-acetylglucosamine transferase
MPGNKKCRILLTGGGSGGHIYPLIAVAESLLSLSAKRGINLDLRYVGAPKQYELMLGAAGVKVRRIAESKLRRYISPLIFWDFLKFLWSIPQALWHVFWFMPDVVFSKGGPGTLPVLYACRFYRIPIIIHESDSIPGLTTRRAIKFVSWVLLAFRNAAEYLPEAKNLKIVGNPNRKELIFNPNDLTDDAKISAKRILELDENKPLILVLGGSQGAQIINNFILEYLPLLTAKYQILHQVGLLNYPEHHRRVSASVENYRDVPFLDKQMRPALMAADLVISRAGSGAIFEIAAAARPAILIPLENSASDHQNENAFQYSAVGACALLKEENMSNPAVVMQLIDSLLADKDKLKKMSENAKMFATPLAADEIAEIILNSCSRK